VLFAFDGTELDTALFELRRHGQRVPMEPQAFDVLVYLVRHRDRVVSRDELMDQVWGGRFVTETAVTSRIKQIRRAVGDDGESQRVIRTLHGRGYRFVAAGADLTAPADSVSSAHVEGPEFGEPPEPVRYTDSDGLSIAYQVSGGGGIDIVLVSGFISHLEQDWGDPRHAHFLHRLGTLGRLIRFDKRGTGMSDRPSGLPDLETRMHDVLAVMDAVGSRTAALFGYSEGGPMATLFAATHPERVSSLVLYAAYAKRTRSDDNPWSQSEEDRVRYSEHLVKTWDWAGDFRLRCPSADETMTAWWGRRSRAATTPSSLRALLNMNALVDIRQALPAVRVPTLVVHRRGDRLIRVEEGRYLAAHIAGAQLVELPGEDHFVSGDPDQIIDPIAAFLTADEQVARQPPALALAALVATSGPGSDRILEALSASGGRLRVTPGGRRIALFDGPATAIRAGLRHVDAGPGDSALGVHVAEVDRDAGELRGFGVATVVALADAAPVGAVWTTGTVRDLLAGSGVALQPVGTAEVGPAGQQPVFAAGRG
jgi:DNA-binding winged helix-turn-helix (wHTH) protein/pimeloyl-ACP methyl ester carboxylesterase